MTARIEAKGGLLITIEDSGAGTAPEELPKIFEPFTQASDTLTRKQEGTGLGLPIVASLAKLHGGSIAIESTLGMGATVTLRFGPERLVAPRISGKEPINAPQRLLRREA